MCAKGTILKWWAMTGGRREDTWPGKGEDGVEVHRSSWHMGWVLLGISASMIPTYCLQPGLRLANPQLMWWCAKSAPALLLVPLTRSGHGRRAPERRHCTNLFPVSPLPITTTRPSTISCPGHPMSKKSGTYSCLLGWEAVAKERWAEASVFRVLFLHWLESWFKQLLEGRIGVHAAERSRV